MSRLRSHSSARVASVLAGDGRGGESRSGSLGTSTGCLCFFFRRGGATGTNPLVLAITSGSWRGSGGGGGPIGATTTKIQNKDCSRIIAGGC